MQVEIRSRSVCIHQNQYWIQTRASTALAIARSAQREGLRKEMMNSPRLLVSIGIGLMLLGIILPFLILIHVLESTFFLNFFSWGASVAGLFLGVIGVATWVRTKRE
jgi:hypothetical protein